MSDSLTRADRCARNLDAKADELRASANLAEFANHSMPSDLPRRTQKANSQPLPAIDDETDTVVVPPAAADAMFYGLIGEFARTASTNTEANPVAVMAATMSWLSAAVGRNPCVPIGDSLQNIRLFTLHVGRSSVGRKGFALAPLKRVIKAIGDLDGGVELRPQKHAGGLSSREGLAWLIHDSYMEGKEEIAGIDDKRLFIIEEEFANVLSQAKRDGNTLSAALRGCWDGESIKPATKTCRVWASRPHVAIHAAITPAELRAKMATVELSNGFANRFLIFFAEKIGSFPFPARLSDALVRSFAERFANVIRFSLNGYPDESKPVLMRLTDEAKGIYAPWYERASAEHPSGELIGGLLQRRAPMVLRISGLLALTDLETSIGVQHVKAAISWMDYYDRSVQLVFEPVRKVNTKPDVERVLRALRTWFPRHPGWHSRTTLSKDALKGHAKACDLDEALADMCMSLQIERRVVQIPATRPKTEYRSLMGVPATKAESEFPHTNFADGCVAAATGSPISQITPYRMPTGDECGVDEVILPP